jgi:hypothetical protein
MPPELVAVTSDGSVNTSVTGTDVASVIGIKTVAFVVGGSNVDVIVYAAHHISTVNLGRVQRS